MKAGRFLLGAGTFVFLSAGLGCTRKSTTATLSLQAPQFTSTKPISLAKTLTISRFSQVSVQSSSGPSFNTNLDPTSASQFNCFAVFVGGPGFNQGGTCTLSDGTSFLLGSFAGGVPAGQDITMDVPSGDRNIVLMGFQAQSASSCYDFHQGMPLNQLSEPYVIARTDMMVNPGTVDVTLSPTFSTTTTPKVTNCQFAGPMAGGGGPYFGMGEDGSLTLSSNSSVSLTSQYNQNGAGSKYLMSVAVVNGITSAATGSATITLSASTPWTAANIGVGDEVMLYVPAGSSVGCGQLFPGFSISGPVTSIQSSTSITMNLPDSRWTSVPVANFGTSATSGSAFCRIVAIRVPHLQDVTVSASPTLSGTSISALDLSASPGANISLGILPIRIAGKLTITSGALTIVENAGGFKGGTSTYPIGQGDVGYLSSSTTGVSNDNGGGLDSSSIGCGGGGGGSGGCSILNTAGLAIGDQYGCGSNTLSDPTMSCLLGKFFFGGGGGGSMTGGAGGGIIRLFANEVDLTGGPLSLQADGGSGMSSPDAGGGGGSIYAGINVLTGASGLSISAKGGNPATVSGGVGGGGRVHLEITGSSSYTGAASVNVNAGTGGVINGATNGTCKADGLTIGGCTP